MAYSVNENNVLFKENAYNKLSIDKYINIRYGTEHFSDNIEQSELYRFSTVLKTLNAQLKSLEIDSEPFLETVEMIKELYQTTNVGELNGGAPSIGEIPEVMPTQITDRESFLDLVLLEKFSKMLSGWVRLSKVDGSLDRRMYGNPQEMVEKCVGFFTSELENLDNQGVAPDDRRRTDLMAKYTHLKSYIDAYAKVESQEARDKYDQELYGDKLPLMHEEAELDILGKNDEQRKIILERIGAKDPRDTSDKSSSKEDDKGKDSKTKNAESTEKTSSVPVTPIQLPKREVYTQTESQEQSKPSTKGTFYYDPVLKDYITDRNDTHSKVRNLLRLSNVGDIDGSEQLRFTLSTSDPIRSLVSAKKYTERTDHDIKEMPADLKKMFKDFVALPYRWLMAKYDRPIGLIDEKDLNNELVIVHHLGTMFSEAFVREPSTENKDGQIHLSQEELDEGISSGTKLEDFDRPVTEVFGVYREDKRGRKTHDVLFANVSDDFILEHKDFFRDVFFSKEYMELAAQNNASYGGTILYVPQSDKGSNYRVNFNLAQDFVRVGALGFAQLTADKAYQALKGYGYTEEQVSNMVNKFTQGQMVNVRGVSDYDPKGKKRLTSVLERMKKVQIDQILLDDIKKQYPGISDYQAADMVKYNREVLIDVHRAREKAPAVSEKKSKQKDEIDIPSFMDPRSPNYYKKNRNKSGDAR